MSSSSVPNEQDHVLGGQISPSVNSPLLGGIEGLQQQMVGAPPEQRSQILTSSLSYGESGVDLLIDALTHDATLTVRALAYELLQSIDSPKAKAAIANGIRLNPGDIIYGVYESAMWYDDEYFHLVDHWDTSIDNMDWPQNGYANYDAFCRSEGQNYEEDLESFIPRRLVRHLSKQKAEAAAEQLHIKFMSGWDDIFSFEIKNDFDLENWCQTNQVNTDGIRDLFDLYEQLNVTKDQDRLVKLWRDGIGNFAFVREETISTPQYFTDLI